MLQFDSLQIHSRARIDLLLAEAARDQLAALATPNGRRPAAVAHDHPTDGQPTPAPARRTMARGLGLQPRARLAASLYTLAVWLDPSLALALGVRQHPSSRLSLPR